MENRMDPINTNRLNREGFKILFDLHTQNVKSRIIQLFEDFQKQRDLIDSASDSHFLVNEVKKIVYESRNRLDVFHVDGIPNIKEFLERNLPSKKLDKLIREAVDMILSSGDSDEQKKRAIHYIKRTQIGLLKEINPKIIDEI